MKNIVLVSFLALISAQSFSQGVSSISINAGPDKCASPTATLTATATQTGFPATTQYNVAQVTPYTNVGYDGTDAYIGIAKVDDVWLNKIFDLGFSFSYFGNTYTQLVIGVNGEVTFDLTKKNTQEGWSYASNLPGAVNNIAIPNNTICAVNRDINPYYGGTIYTKNIGSAPCRSFVVSWVGIPLFAYPGNCSGTPLQTFQLVLSESTNQIDVNIQTSTACTAQWGGGGIIGVQAGQTSGIYKAAPNRNVGAGFGGTPWSASNESWRFSPNGTASTVPYTGTITWTGPNGFTATGTSINVSPTTTATYTASISATNCSGTLNASDQVFVSAQPSSDFSYATNRTAGSPFYTITATAVATPTQFSNLSFDWSIEEVNSSDVAIPNTRVDNPVCWWYYPVQNTFPGYDYTVTYTSANNTGTLFNYNGSTCAVTTPGKFRAGGRYRIQHGTYTPQCGFNQTSHVVYMSARPGGNNVLSIDEKSIDAALDVYPNPSNGSFIINARNKDLKDVYVYDVMGKVVYSKQNTIEETFQIDVTQLPKGLYLVKVVSNNEIQVQKVISE